MNIVNVTTENFKAELLDAAEPVVVDLWAAWCGPCRAAAPVLADLAQEYAGKVKVAKINVDEQPALAQAFKVQGIPMFAVVWQGAIVGSVSGFGGRPGLANLFEQVAALPELAQAEQGKANP